MDVPFSIARIFYMHNITPGLERGGHAHRDTDQVLIPVSGHFKVDLSDGVSTQAFELLDATRGLYVPRMTWTRLYEFSEGAVCLVLASTHYDMSKSLRTWNDFVDARNI